MTPGPALDPEIIWFLTCRFKIANSIVSNVSIEEFEYIQLEVMGDSRGVSKTYHPSEN
jgi:hypothetical protein